MVTSLAGRRLLARCSRSHAPTRGPADGRGRARARRGAGGHRPETAVELRAPPLPERHCLRGRARRAAKPEREVGRGESEGEGVDMEGGSSDHAPRRTRPPFRPPGPADAGSWDVQGSPPVDVRGARSLVTEEV